jgi:hypothetical protein
MIIYSGFCRWRSLRSVIEMDSISKRTGGNRAWAIGAIHIRAEMEFRAHSQSYLKITAGDL